MQWTLTDDEKTIVLEVKDLWADRQLLLGLVIGMDRIIQGTFHHGGD
ncbi:hypothetical protein [Nitrosopumilus ureiphilus]|nr:hypothetical protein [Nitrosopumilus ureiphilus]